MSKPTPQELREQAQKLLEQADQIENGGATKEADGTTAEPPRVNPSVSERTKLPVDHPESQAVERIHYEMQAGLCSDHTKEKRKDQAEDE